MSGFGAGRATVRLFCVPTMSTAIFKASSGAVNVTGVDFESGHSTVVNGLREDFSGFLINGISNKGLSCVSTRPH